MSRTFVICASLLVMAGVGVYAVSGTQNAQMIVEVQKAMGMSTCSYDKVDATMASVSEDECCASKSTEVASYTCPVSGEVVMASYEGEAATCSLDKEVAVAGETCSAEKSCSMETVAVAGESCSAEKSCSLETEAVATSESVEVANVQ